ncbi:ZP domain-containing protein-like [Scleropages formosus]|uniref:ZP domain-containing protein-like n=2 Tax=Scleropages formosus TaxID=113540 RepID=A0A8C9SZV4_SCLFO|nr:ZP domain-containing protein-like [Scleropages formosus]
MRVTTLTMMHMSVFLLLVSSASASHYYGGFLTFTPKGLNPDGSLTVEILYREAYRICFPYQTWYCYSGNCGITTRSVTGQIASYSGPSYSWCQLETILIKNVPTDSPFEMREASCCWIYAPNNNGQWNLFAHIDLGTRSDTRKPNSSPVTTIPPFIRVLQNCPQTINILAHDPDGDHVRCRYGTVQNMECGTCYNDPDFYLDENLCTLKYNKSNIIGPHIFELVLEDYPTRPITVSHMNGMSLTKYPFHTSSNGSSSPTTTAPDPLSKIPLQFVVVVDQASPSCTPGQYIPKFVFPTPGNGESLSAPVKKEMKFIINATAIYAMLSAIVITGPLNMTEYVTMHGHFAEAVIKWTPTDDDLGDNVPICFTAQSTFGTSTFESEMRCLTVIVVHSIGTGTASVFCTEGTMTVEVDKSSVPGLHEENLHLKDPLCTLTSNSTHVIGIMSLNSCGTEVEEDNTTITFKNEIISFESADGIIARTNDVRIGFSCNYPKRGQSYFEFTVHKIPFVFTEKGFGTFTYQFEIFHSSLFNSMVDPSTYPVEVNLGEMMYLQIVATAQLSNTILFVESCRATPSDNHNYPIFYSIIENGCIVDDTVVIYAGNQTVFRFGMEAFKFIGLHERVYITCSVILCEAGNHTRCSQGCVNGTATPAPHYRRRRAAITETSSHFISQGPLQLRRSSDSIGSSLTLNMNVVFIAGALLVALATVCGALMYRTKMSALKYQKLPSTEF